MEQFKYTRTLENLEGDRYSDITFEGKTIGEIKLTRGLAENGPKYWMPIFFGGYPDLDGYYWRLRDAKASIQSCRLEILEHEINRNGDRDVEMQAEFGENYRQKMNT